MLVGCETSAKTWSVIRTKVQSFGKGTHHPIARKRKPGTEQQPRAHQPAPSLLLELPLRVTPGQARRLRRMRTDPAWQAARAIPHTQKQERARAFGALRQQSGFSGYALHDAAKVLNCAWIADHVDAVLAQTLATRAYRALNRVCLGQAHRVRFKSRGRGLGSVENKRANTGLRFVLQPPEQGNAGYLLWQDDRLPALIDWKDPVVTYGLAHFIKSARLIQRTTSSPRAEASRSSGPAVLRATGARRDPLSQTQTLRGSRHPFS